MGRIDELAILQAYLLSVSALATEVSNQISKEPMPAGVKPNTKAIVYARTGGTPHATTPIVRPSFRFRCYGGDSVEAQTIYRLLVDALAGPKDGDEASHQATLNAAGIYVANEETEGQDMVDAVGEDWGWDYVLTFFEIGFAGI